MLAPSKLTTIAKIKVKLEEFEKEKGKTWIELVEEEVVKAPQEIEAHSQPNKAASDWQGLHLDNVSVGEDAAPAEADEMSKWVHNTTAKC